jgi:hypothetical protein
MSETSEQASSRNSPDTPAVSARRRSKFFVVYAGVFLLILLAGFGRTFYLRPLFMDWPLAPIVVAHGVVLTAWFLLLFAQAWLVSNGRLSAHRLLGIVGCAIAAAAVAIFIPTALGAIPRNVARMIEVGQDIDPAILASPQRTAQMLADLGFFAAFPFFVVLAILYRRRPESHKRLMLLASIALLVAVVPRIFRWPALTVVPEVPANLVLMAALLIVPAVHDRITRGRVHPVFAWGAPLYYLWALVSGFGVPGFVMQTGLVL